MTEENEESGADATEAQSGHVKVSEEFQEEAGEMVNGLKTIAELNYLMDLVSEQRKKLESSQKKNHLNTPDFSTEGMPQQ